MIVRSIDLPQWWSADVPEALRQRALTPPQSVGARGVADASLYRRARQAGLRDLTCFPALVTLDQPEGPIWRYREDHLTAQLSPSESPPGRPRATWLQGRVSFSWPIPCTASWDTSPPSEIDFSQHVLRRHRWLIPSSS